MPRRDAAPDPAYSEPPCLTGLLRLLGQSWRVPFTPMATRVGSRWREPPPEESGFDIGGWDEELGRFVHWKERQRRPYREREAERRFRDLRHPGIWALQAWELREAGDALWRTRAENYGKRPGTDTPWTIGFSRVALMLAGMSLENALKAVRICSLDGWPIDDAGFRQIAKGAHRLNEMATRAKVRTNACDRDTLRHLSHCIRWSGRYPLPREVDELKGHALGGWDSEDAVWDAYLRVRVKIGKCVARALRDWSKRQMRDARASGGHAPKNAASASSSYSSTRSPAAS